MQTADGSRMELEYNNLRFINSTTWYDAYGDITSRVTVTNDVTGKIVIHAEPANETTVFIYDEYSNIGYIKEMGLLSHGVFRNYETNSKMTTAGDLVS